MLFDSNTYKNTFLDNLSLTEPILVISGGYDVIGKFFRKK